MYEVKQEYSYVQALNSAVKQQLQAEIAISRFPTAAARSVLFCLFDVLELRRLFFKSGKPTKYQELKSKVWN